VKPTQPLTDITMEEPSEKNQNTWRVDFPNDSRTYVIEFKTSVDEKVIEGSASYDNTASIVISVNGCVGFTFSTEPSGFVLPS
jgi:hypothetical protein